MNFMESVKAMKEGKQVRRKNWDEDGFMCVPEDGVIIRKQDKEIMMFSIRDFEATDWEIEEKKTLSDKRRCFQHHGEFEYEEKDVKEAIVKFIDWVHLRRGIREDTKDKAKEIFGEELLR